MVVNFNLDLHGDIASHLLQQDYRKFGANRERLGMIAAQVLYLACEELALSRSGSFVVVLCDRKISQQGVGRAQTDVIDHLKSSLFELRPETSDIICAEGAITRRSSMV
jgi:hypothetical protein